MKLDLKIPWQAQDEEARRTTGFEFYGIRDQWNAHDSGVALWNNVNAFNGTFTTLTIGSTIVTIPLPIAAGGTNSTTALNNGRVMGSSSGKIVELSLGQIPAVATNTAASAGNIGEIITTGTVGATNLTNGVLTDIGSINLTAGNWMLYGQIFFHNTTNVDTQAVGAVTTTSGNSFTGAVQGVTRMDTTPGNVAGTDCGVNITQPVSIASTTTYYLKAFLSFTLGQGQAGGILFGIRTS